MTKPDSRLARYRHASATSARLAEPGEVHALEGGAPIGAEVGVAAVVEHVARADRVAADPVPRLLDGDRPGQPVQPGLGRDVRREPGARALALAGRDVDDRAVTRRAHVRDRGPRHTTSVR